MSKPFHARSTYTVDGYAFTVTFVGLHTTANVNRNPGGDYIMTYRGKYLCRCHWKERGKYARYFARELAEPPAPPIYHNMEKCRVHKMPGTSYCGPWQWHG